MASTFEVPLTPTPQTFAINLGPTKYQMTLIWRDVPSGGGGWFLDIADSGGTAIISGIPLVTGRDLLSQFNHLGIGGQIWVSTDGDPNAVPTSTNLGQQSHLYFYVP